MPRRRAEARRLSQSPAVPRTRDGKPDLSGIWQAFTTANDNLLSHSASKDVPAGLGVVEGDEIPYRPEALAKKQENFANRATRDTEAKCYLPGVPRITYMPFPFQIIQTPDVTTILYEYLHAIRYIYTNGSPHPQRPTRLVDGRFARPLGGRHAGRRRRAFRRRKPGSTGPATTTAMPCTSSSGTRSWMPITSTTK